MRCPDCRTESDGAFCPECGASLRLDACPSCGAAANAGARYCTQCGTGLHGQRRGRGSPLPWILAGIALAGVVGVLVWQAAGPAPPVGTPAGATPFRTATAGPPAGGAPPPLTGTPREQADRLFNRVMRELEQGDTAQARFFSPMAIQAYQMAEPLDDDGAFHLSLVQTVGGDPGAGLATARQVLERSPDHLLALIAAAQAAETAGDAGTARAYYARYVRVYETESAKPLPEYQDHASVLPAYRDQAEIRSR